MLGVPEVSTLVATVLAAAVAAVVSAVVAAFIPSARRWIGSGARVCAGYSRGLYRKARSRDDVPAARPGVEEPTDETARPRHAVSASESGGTSTSAEVRSGAGAGVVIAVLLGNTPVAGADALALFPNKTWVHARTDSDGVASLELHSLHLPMTVWVAAEGCTARVETGWVPSNGVLKVELSALADGGSMVITQGTGHIPGLAGRLNPIRDTSDRTYLYADNIAINGGQPQPVSFLPGEEQLRLVDANGNEFLVRVAAIIGRSSLLEYSRSQPQQHAQQQDTATPVTLSLSARIMEGARDEAHKDRRSLEAWIAALVRGALDDPDPLAGGRLGSSRPMERVEIEIVLPAHVHEGAQRAAAGDDRTLENWIEALIEMTVRRAEPLIMGGGPSYYDGGRKRR